MPRRKTRQHRLQPEETSAIRELQAMRPDLRRTFCGGMYIENSGGAECESCRIRAEQWIKRHARAGLEVQMIFNFARPS